MSFKFYVFIHMYLSFHPYIIAHFCNHSFDCKFIRNDRLLKTLFLCSLFCRRPDAHTDKLVIFPNIDKFHKCLYGGRTCEGNKIKFVLRQDRLQCKLDFIDRKSTRLNSSHVAISYAVFCLTKKKEIKSNVKCI